MFAHDLLVGMAAAAAVANLQRQSSFQIKLSSLSNQEHSRNVHRRVSTDIYMDIFAAPFALAMVPCHLCVHSLDWCSPQPPAEQIAAVVSPAVGQLPALSLPSLAAMQSLYNIAGVRRGGLVFSTEFV